VSDPVRPLQDLLLLDRTGPGVHERDTDRTWWGHDAQFGGYVEALALAAMRAELDDPTMGPVSTTVHFFRPFVDGPFRAEVSVERRGRTMANVYARLFSQGKLAGQAVSAFAVRRAPAELRIIEPPAELALPVGAEEADAPSQLGIPTHALFRFIPRLGDFRMGSGGPAVGGWVLPRFVTPVDESYLAVLQDLWLPAIYHQWPEPAVAVSVDITTQFRAALPLDESIATHGLFVLLRTAGSLGGFVDEDCEVWSPSGELLLQGRQLRFVH
jgi:acyl-CoA thioesterase superfamily protein/acyl-Coa thioesterase superfamily protein